MPRQGESRARILKAAAGEFATHGYAAARVDRIARRARLNKAMVYYHFGSKLGLYRAIFLEILETIRARVDALAEEAIPPAVKLRRVVELYVETAEARPHMPQILLREVANRGQHFSPEMAQTVTRLWHALGGIIDEGVKTSGFTPVSPLLMHMSIVAPLMMFLATGPARSKLLKHTPFGTPTRDQIVAQLQATMLAMVGTPPARGPRSSAPSGPPRPPRRPKPEGGGGSR